MPDREKVIKAFDDAKELVWLEDDEYTVGYNNGIEAGKNIALAMMKEQEKKQITLHKKHIITWGRSDEFSMRNLYEKICETLLDEGELFIARTDDHEKVDFVFYVTEGR